MLLSYRLALGLSKWEKNPETWGTFPYGKVGRKHSGIEGGIPEVPVMS